MRKYMFLLAALALFSCAKEQNIPEEEQPIQEEVVPQEPETTLKHLTFTGITDDGLTKTTLGPGNAIVWSSPKDSITVFTSASAKGIKFNCTGTARSGLEATFTGTAPSPATYYALSPAQTGSASFSDGIITATLPTTQTAVEGSYAPEANISVATASDYVFQFKNVGALVGFKIVDEGITSVRLEALNGEVLSGTAVIDPSVNPDENGFLVEKSGNTYVELSGSFVQNSTYYFVVLPGTYSGGFRTTLYKGTQYIRRNNTESKDIVRNGNYYLGDVTGSNWKYIFNESEGVVIKGAGADEADQDVAYVGNVGRDGTYWNTIDHANVTNYAYNYEIFTRLNAQQYFWFEADGGAIFTLSNDGRSVSPIASYASAKYQLGENEGGIYRIRMHLPEGVAEIKKIEHVKFHMDGWAAEQELDYIGNGEWSCDNLPIQNGSADYQTRYKFHFYFSGSNEYYGRTKTVTDTERPFYDGTTPTYFYVQPADNDTWEPGFKFPLVYKEIKIDPKTENPYHGHLSLKMNNENGHYTHQIEKVWPIIAGEDIYIAGGGVDETDSRMKVRFNKSFYNTDVDMWGDQGTTLAAPEGYDYEIFVRLKYLTKFYFESASGTLFALNSKGSDIVKINSTDDIEYDGGPVDPGTGNPNRTYRIRIKSDTKKATLNSIWEVHYLQPGRDNLYGSNLRLDYIGNGTWREYPAWSWDDNHSWNDNRKYGIKFQMYFDNGVNIWQYLGRHSGDNVQFIQDKHTYPNSDSDKESSWDNFLMANYHDNWINGSWTWMNVNLQLNSEGYKYWLDSFRN